MASLVERLRHARESGTVVGFALNRATEGIDVRPLLTDEELVEFDGQLERRLQQAKEEERRREEEQLERLRRQKEYEEWCATLPQIGIKAVELHREIKYIGSLRSFYTELDRYGIATHKHGNRRWVTKEDADLYLLLRKCDTRTGWSSRGRSVSNGAEPVGNRRTGYGYVADLYSEEQTRPKRRHRPGSPQSADNPETLLAAMFSVNRSAKRYRDAASSCYESAKLYSGRWSRRSRSGCHALAQIHSRRKENLYRLKDAALVWAVRRGWLAPVAKHGCLTVYHGHGYCFHSLLVPSDWTPPDTDNTDAGAEGVFVEQKPREATDMPLKDAVATLENLPTETDGFEREQFPAMPRQPQTRRWIYDEWDDGWDDEDDEWDDDEWDE